MRLRLSNGLSLAYRSRGAGRPVVMLHPIGTRAAFWDGVIDRVSDRYRCLSVDMRGFGESDVPSKRFSIDDLADDVCELLQMQDAQGAVVVGCSMGGMVAQGVALKMPERLAGIIPADTSYTQTDASRKALAQRSVDTLKTGMPGILHTTLARWFPAPFLALHGPEVQQVAHWLLEDDPTVFAWGWQAIHDLAYGERLKTIAMPALCVRGSEDASSARANMEAMAALLPRGRYIEIEGAGHVAPMEQPAEFVKLLVDFIENEIGK